MIERNKRSKEPDIYSIIRLRTKIQRAIKNEYNITFIGLVEKVRGSGEDRTGDFGTLLTRPG